MVGGYCLSFLSLLPIAIAIVSVLKWVFGYVWRSWTTAVKIPLVSPFDHNLGFTLMVNDLSLRINILALFWYLHIVLQYFCAFNLILIRLNILTVVLELARSTITLPRFIVK